MKKISSFLFPKISSKATAKGNNKQLKEQKKEIVNKIKSYETDLKIFREEKNKIKNELLSHYNTILHEGKDIRKDGLSWIHNEGIPKAKKKNFMYCKP